jgi:hypothetical protein
VHLTRGTLRLNEGADDVTTLPYADADGLADAIASLKPAGARSRRSRSMLVLVEPPLLQRRTLKDLPPVRDAALRELVAQGAARFFRQNGQALLSAATWAAKGPSAERVAHAVAVEKAFAEAIVVGAARGGFQLEDVIAGAETGKRLSLLPIAERRKRDARWWRRAGMTAMGAVLLGIAVGGVLLIQVRAERRWVGEALARLKAPVAGLAAARLSLDSALVAVLAMQAAESQRITVASRLFDAVRVLPDSACLTSLTLDRIGTGMVEGRAMEAGQVETHFGEMRAFAPVRLTSGGTRDSTAGRAWERFTLGLGVEDGE